MNTKFLKLICVALFISQQCFAQNNVERINLNDSSNQKLFGSQGELVTVIIEAVKSKKIEPFMDEKLAERMPLQTFLTRLLIPSSNSLEENNDNENWEGWGERPDLNNDNTEEVRNEYFSQQLSLMDIYKNTETNEIQSIAIRIPGELFPHGLEDELASFSYSELKTKVFQNNPDLIQKDEETGQKLDFLKAFEAQLYTLPKE